MRMQDYIEDKKSWAYLIDGERVIEYDEAVSCDFWENHPEIHDRLESDNFIFMGTGYLCNHDWQDHISCDTHPSRIYVWSE